MAFEMCCRGTCNILSRVCDRAETEFDHSLAAEFTGLLFVERGTFAEMFGCTL